MVKGLDVFRDYFKEYSDKYVIIGGTAENILLERSGLTPRATKDIDAILIVEALTKEFGQRFWGFIRDGEYQNKQTSTNETQHYRFDNPGNKAFPDTIELFSRKPDVIEIPEGFHLTPIPLDKELSSFSAILLDDHYYYYSLDNTIVIEELPFVNEKALVILKAKAYLNNSKLYAEKKITQSHKITKHKNDIYRIVITLPGDTRYDIPDEIREDLRTFLGMIQKEDIGTRDICKKMGIQEVPFDIFLENFLQIFGL